METNKIIEYFNECASREQVCAALLRVLHYAPRNNDADRDAADIVQTFAETLAAM